MKKGRLKGLVSRLKGQKESFDRELKVDMQELFNIPVSQVLEYAMTENEETGIIVSGDKQYRFKIGLETKELQEIE